MSIELFYFSGTGNSLHIARELQNRLPGTTLTPIISHLDDKMIRSNAETMGFIFPLYLMTVPAPVRSFLKRIDLNNVKYIFTVVTYAGTLCLADGYVSHCLKKYNHRLNAFFLIKMISNSPTGLRPGTGNPNWVNEISREHVTTLEKSAEDKLIQISKIISNQETYTAERTKGIVKSMLAGLISAMTANMKTKIPFYPDATCNACQICEKVCPSKKIKLVNNKPVWQKNLPCYYCYACFNYCPQQAILVNKKYTTKSGRYHHPSITATDISEQKSGT